MNHLLDAFYNLVHKVYPGGATALAPRLDKSSTTLCHEVRPPHGSSAKLGLMDAIEIMELTDARPLQLICQRFGGMFVPLPQLGSQHENTMAHTAAVATEFSDVLREVSIKLADGHVSDNDLRSIQKEWGELLSAGQAMLAHLAALNEAGKPPQLQVVAKGKTVAA
jgi:hypothetical protein